MTSSGLEPGTLWLVTWCLNHLRYRAAPILYIHWWGQYIYIYIYILLVYLIRVLNSADKKGQKSDCRAKASFSNLLVILYKVDTFHLLVTNEIALL
jgi:hypothetical protein